MPARPLTLAPFLSDRLDERAEDAGCLHRYDCASVRDAGATLRADCDCGYPARVLVEVECKRRIGLRANGLIT